jgi:hypothetical protein
VNRFQWELNNQVCIKSHHLFLYNFRSLMSIVFACTEWVRKKIFVCKRNFKKVQFESFDRFWESWDDEKSFSIQVLCESVASSGTEAGLRQNHVIRLRWLCTERSNFDPSTQYIRESLILDKTSSNITMRYIIYTFDNNQSKAWKDLFKLLSVDDESVIIQFSSESTKFRSTMIKSYYDDDYLENSSLFISINDLSFIEFVSSTESLNMSQSNDQFVASNDQKSESEIFSNSFKRDRDRLRKYFASTAFLSFVFNVIVDFVFASISLFAVVSKLDLIVHIAFSQFVAFRQKEINESSKKMFFS